FLGTTTSNVTRRSPGLPLPVSIPRPRTFTVLPLCVPAGTFTVTGLSSVGTFTCVPSAASVNVIGTRTVRSLPLRPKIGCFPTCTTTNRSPGGPPFAPAAPRLGTRPVAHRPHGIGGEAHAGRDAVHRVEEVEVQLGLEVDAALRTGLPGPAATTPAPAPAAAAASATEQTSEQVAEAGVLVEL